MTTLAVDAPKWTDVLTAIGTVALAAIAVVTIIVTGVLAKRERTAADTRAEQARAEADDRLREEREAADARLRDERDHAERVRLRERQTAYAGVLLDQIAEFQSVVGKIPGLNRGRPRIGPVSVSDEAAVLASLQRSMHAEAPLLGEAVTEGRYRTLVRLALAMADEPQADADRRKRTVGDLLNYAVLVRVSLKAVINGEPVPDPGYPEYPDLWREADVSLWYPTMMPADFMEELQTEPDHPQFRKIERPQQQ